MIVTEDEAKTKRCQEGFGPPLVDAMHGNVVMHAMPGGVIAAASSPIHCIGSACMAWRWFDNLDDGAVITPLGYCGKAGKP